MRRAATSMAASTLALVLAGCGAPTPPEPVAAAPVPLAPPSPEPTEAAPAAASATSPYRAVATRKGRIAPLGHAAEPPVIGVMANLPVELRGDAIVLRADLLAGLAEQGLGPMFRIEAAYGHWPDDVFLALNDTFNGDVFQWRASRWEPLGIGNLGVSSGGFITSFHVARWNGRVVVTENVIYGTRFVRPGSPKLPTAQETGCEVTDRQLRDYLPSTYTAALVNVGEELLWLGQCIMSRGQRFIAVHWAKSPKGEVRPLPIEGEASSIEAIPVADGLFLGTHPEAKGTPKLHRYEQGVWTEEAVPGVVDLAFLAFQSSLFAAAPGRLWVRTAAGQWSEEILPSLAGPSTPLAVWEVDDTRWVAVQVSDPRQEPPTVTLLRRSMSGEEPPTPTVPSDEETRAALATALGHELP